MNLLLVVQEPNPSVAISRSGWPPPARRQALMVSGAGSRERLTLIRVFEALRRSGYEGGYDAVRRYAQTWRRDQVSASAVA